ncbi:MAG: divalent-cation tolerance protein CutA [Candidatus Krumholzibacteria bacterium]|nr:divalent-cation tolerance protein CutA [Candidatus Krumholzibacteria bacterium]
MSTGDLRVLVTTFPDREQAEKITRLLIDAGLAVCGQVGADLVTFYRWEAEVKQDEEVSVSYKIVSDRFDLFVSELKQQHPYDVPQLIAWQADWTDKAYLDWAKGQGK